MDSKVIKLKCNNVSVGQLEQISIGLVGENSSGIFECDDTVFNNLEKALGYKIRLEENNLSVQDDVPEAKNLVVEVYEQNGNFVESVLLEKVKFLQVVSIFLDEYTPKKKGKTITFALYNQ
jgi:hypothetical protein